MRHHRIGAPQKSSRCADARPSTTSARNPAISSSSSTVASSQNVLFGRSKTTTRGRSLALTLYVVVNSSHLTPSSSMKCRRSRTLAASGPPWRASLRIAFLKERVRRLPSGSTMAATTRRPLRISSPNCSSPATTGNWLSVTHLRSASSSFRSAPARYTGSSPFSSLATKGVARPSWRASSSASLVSANVRDVFRPSATAAYAARSCASSSSAWRWYTKTTLLLLSFCMWLSLATLPALWTAGPVMRAAYRAKPSSLRPPSYSRGSPSTNTSSFG
mmetsp:Transcript_9308/g.32791  ORF Transcript_9308/g.32791 Transcript_9308/m.32791 type:complete len:275 (-) Transcript_9308:316-1140(-)